MLQHYSISWYYIANLLLPLHPFADGLPVMDCPNNTQTLNITIPSVVIIKSDGEALNKAMAGGSRGELWSLQ